jgi:hypothetical protein
MKEKPAGVNRRASHYRISRLALRPAMAPYWSPVLPSSEWPSGKKPFTRQENSDFLRDIAVLKKQYDIGRSHLCQMWVLNHHAD